MHHLILIRDGVEPVPDAARTLRIDGVGRIYRAVRAAFREEVAVTVLDPRNGAVLSLLLLRDTVRFRVPVSTLLQTIAHAGVCSAVLDGQVLFRGELPEPDTVIELIRGRLEVHRVGEAERPGGPS